MLNQTQQTLKEKKSRYARKKILYVEDDLSSQFLVDHILKNKYDLDVAAKGMDALRMAHATKYDLILMDIKLGKGKTGIDVTHELRQLPQYKNVPILAVTAYAMPGDDDYFIDEGCTDYISKPIDFGEFKRKIAALLQ